MAFEKAHAKLHNEMKEAQGKSNSHIALSALSLFLTAVSIESKESQAARRPPRYLRSQAKHKGLTGEEGAWWATTRFELWKSQQPMASAGSSTAARVSRTMADTPFHQETPSRRCHRACFGEVAQGRR
jgi:hypothetical protein